MSVENSGFAYGVVVAVPDAQPCGKLPPGTVLAKKGTYTAFDAKCTHQGCMIKTKIKGDDIVVA